MSSSCYQIRSIKYPIILFVVLAIAGCSSNKKTIGTANAPVPSDQAIFDSVQKASFQYFWSGAEPNSGMARERIHLDNVYPQNDQSTVTTGGSGFGIMAILTGIERGFITRSQGLERMERIVQFLETADRFHGAWPHWMYGETGKVKPFSTKDDGGDLVETSFLIQGLLCARQYFNADDSREKTLVNRINQLWEGVDFDWYRNGQNVLYWNWSPDYNWDMNFPVKGYNECLIMYILAASSPTHGVPPAVYHEGWARNGAIRQTAQQYGYTLQLKHNGAEDYGGPLFWAHYSYLGLDPKGLKDQYANYWEENKNQTLINYTWCVQNANQCKGYGPDSWGLTASYSMKGYAGHAPGPQRDLCVIAPTAALSSMPYTPEQSKAAMKNWYLHYKDKLWGEYGFYDAFSESNNWFPKRYLAIDQGPIVVMMENYRSGLLWKLFMSCQEIKSGLQSLGFESPWLK